MTDELNFQMRKSLLALYQSGHDAAVVINSIAHNPIGMITVTDCLRAIVLTMNIDPKISDRPVYDFIRLYGTKNLITATVNMSLVLLNYFKIFFCL